MGTIALPLLLGLLSLAAALVGVCLRYRAKPHRPLPARKACHFAWLPKYLVEVPRHWPRDDLDRLANELQEWLAPLGMQLRHRSETELVLGNAGRQLDCRVRLTVPLPAASPLQVRLEYDAGVLFDTGDLWRLGRAIASRDEQVDEAFASARKETGNPYQSPQS